MKRPSQDGGASETAFSRIGGEKVLRAIVNDFVGRMFEDVMIGFLFVGKNKDRLIQMEYQLAAQQMGAPITYQGRDLQAVHQKLPIMGGHFARRRKILENTLREHDVPTDIIAGWLDHVDALRDDILGSGVDGSHCDHEIQKARVDEG
jgi:hemoglobin